MSAKDMPPPYTPYSMPGVHQQAPPGYPQQPPSAYPQATAQGVYPHPPPQWQQPMHPAYGTVQQQPPPTTTVVMTQPEVIIVGGCPHCRIGILEDNYGLCALCCAIVFFPAGLLCCLLMKERKCSHCGAVFD